MKAGGTDQQPDNPISHSVNVLTLPTRGLDVEIKPDVGALVALAALNGLVRIEDFAATVALKRWHKDGIRATGHIQASLVQSCGVSLQDVSQHLETDIDTVLLPDTSKLAKRIEDGQADEILIDPEGDDAPDLFELPWLDVGDIVQEFFALAIDPFPRAPGAEAAALSTAKDTSDDGDDEKPNPFAKLASLKDKL